MGDSLKSEHRWQFHWTPGSDATPVLCWTRYVPVYAPTGQLLDGVPEHRSTDLERLGGLGMHRVPASDDYWRFLGPTKGWAISFMEGSRFVLWDPAGNIELAGSAEEAGADPALVSAIAEKVRVDGEITLFSGQLMMTDQSAEIQQARDAGNLLVGSAVYIESAG